MATQFGRLPIQMRQWVRHVIDVPGDGGWAFEWNGSITFIRPTDNMMNVVVHETGHSLDLNGACKLRSILHIEGRLIFSTPDHDNPLSSSDNWWNNYNQDPNVPDPYAGTNAREDIAQNTVVSVFNENVPGGFGSIEPNWHNIFHQYATLIGESNDAGQGNGLFKPGENVAASHRLPNSAPVPMTNNAHKVNVEQHGAAPDVSIKSKVKLISTAHRAADPHSGCTLRW